MDKKVIAVIILLSAGATFAWWYLDGQKAVISSATITTFEECTAAGNPVMESYPRQCNTKDGKHFVEDIGNTIEKVNLIHLDSPQPNAIVTSPLTLTGEARGNWYFEASFPVELTDEGGNPIVRYYAEAQGDWMTTEFVPFKSTLTFTKKTTTRGFLILHKDNPSGLEEHDDFLRIPVRFQ